MTNDLVLGVIIGLCLAKMLWLLAFRDSRVGGDVYWLTNRINTSVTNTTDNAG